MKSFTKEEKIKNLLEEKRRWERVYETKERSSYCLKCPSSFGSPILFNIPKTLDDSIRELIMEEMKKVQNDIDLLLGE